MRTPELRARQIIAMDDTRDLFARSLARRSGHDPAGLDIAVHAAVAVAVFTTALQTWAQTDDGDLVAIIDASFTAVKTATAQVLHSAMGSRSSALRERSSYADGRV
jgi:hypothetical protein